MMTVGDETTAGLVGVREKNDDVEGPENKLKRKKEEPLCFGLWTARPHVISSGTMCGNFDFEGCKKYGRLYGMDYLTLESIWLYIGYTEGEGGQL
jgi:hypothetical protein